MDKKTLDFIEKSILKFGDKFDYSKTIHTGYRNKIIYECKVHGIIDFQNPQDHLRSKNGCPKCSGNNSKNTELIIQEFYNKHGNKFNYEKVDYKNNKTKVLIVCNTCSHQFLQAPSDHLSGKGCPKCIGRNFTKEEIINQLNKIHKFKYDYSNAIWKIKKDKINIVCPIHGDFEQMLESHLSGKGCSMCGRQKTSQDRINNFTQKDFIKEARFVHGDEYDYSKALYVKRKNNVNIVCRKHGSFSIKAISHLRGSGCWRCSVEKRSITQSMDSIDYFKKCKQIHSNQYEYDETSYQTMSKSIIYYCEIHGKRTQQAQSHLRGSGCNKCGEERRRVTQNLNAEILFWKQVGERKIDKKYDLTNFKYKGVFAKSIVVCLKHGKFLVSADNLKRGKGCPKCASSKGESAIQDYLSKRNITFSCEVKSKDLFENSLFLVEHENTRYDFVLHNHHLIIEFDGEQHFRPVGFGASEEKTLEYFKRVVEKDKAKDELAQQSKYDLIRIPYWKIDDIKMILDEIIVSNNKINKEAIPRYNYKSNRIAYEIDILDLGIPNINDEDL